ncbi:hypothetical protein AAMO2058_001159600 [Amorphochlora amoebiformis]|mmetsp:Transcript_13582/g.21468  ORF Transcript_13582/g.21468 Transcript_13582/m.21468 type:complete len:490 (-) Transcript_13582:59-1528(-)
MSYGSALALCIALCVGGVRHSSTVNLSPDSASMDQARPPYPTVSITTPVFGTLDMRHVSGNMIKNLMRQKYPSAIEYVIIHVAEKPSLYLKSLSSKATIGEDSDPVRKVRYYYLPQKAHIDFVGHLRNAMLQVVHHDVILNMDADDFYLSGYVERMVDELIRTDVQNVAASLCRPYKSIGMGVSDLHSERYFLTKHQLKEILARKKQVLTSTWTSASDGDQTTITDPIKAGVSREIVTLRNSSYGKCSAEWAGYSMAFPRFFVGTNISTNMIFDNYTEQYHASFKGILHSHYREDGPVGEEFELVRGMVMQLTQLRKNNTYQRCMKSYFKSLPNYCQAIRNSVLQDPGDEYGDARLFNPGGASVPNFQGPNNTIPIAIKVVWAESLTKRHWMKVKTTEEEKQKLDASLPIFLTLLDIAVSSGEYNDGSYRHEDSLKALKADGSYVSLDHVKSFWCGLSASSRSTFVSQMAGEVKAAGGLTFAEITNSCV